MPSWWSSPWWAAGSVVVDVRLGEGEVFEPIEGDWYVFLIRHGAYADRATGADPWGLQVTELRLIPDV
ncbi:hypothetical protein [Rhizomonospora bruguierae]|uniref:hypothetical protein n=1 Tax=Rhizomonospora bruguierae TaxID=1581705 RepID=UPI001BD13450|nr:hypothetical protein [Micromonospora sp. NBRC 107566]